MIPRPFAELEALARERYQQRYAEVPEPTPRNVDAVMAFTQPREFTWGGVGYRAPPLPFREGLRLLTAANALRDLREEAVPHPAALQAAQRTAAYLVRGVVIPVAWPLRLVWRFAHHAFEEMTPAQLERLIRELLAVPDATPVAPPEGPSTLDFMDVLLAVAAAFPGWVTAEGLPLSWAHWVYASRHLSRAAARQQLLWATAGRAATFQQRDWTEWFEARKQAAAWDN